jgi:cytochrome P450
VIPPKPQARNGNVSLRRYAKLLRKDILSALPDRLYRAKMAEFRMPFIRSFLLNEPHLVRHVLTECPSRYPKSTRVARGLRPLLGQSVFLTNGALWQKQRRIIDPAFAEAGLKASLPAMQAAAQAAEKRFQTLAGPAVQIDALASHAAADVIFRTLFSRPISDTIAAETYAAFRSYQRLQPVLSPRAFLPFGPGRAARREAEKIRRLITMMVQERVKDIANDCAPDDLATRILQARDPQTDAHLSETEMVDQVAIFFLAGHETSAAALAWALYLLAVAPEWQDRVATDARRRVIGVSDLGSLRDTRDVVRETLRLYPPVPMMVRQAAARTEFRKRAVPCGSQLIISPWHLHRHKDLWPEPDRFDPTRWRRAGGCPNRSAYLPFSAGPRICPGAGFAMAEVTVLLTALLRDWRVYPVDRPVPVAHLTLRSQDGIRLRIEPRNKAVTKAQSEWETAQ